MVDDVNVVPWNMLLAYRMVRQRDHSLSDRQRILQDERDQLLQKINSLNALINKLGDSISVVEKAGGDASKLRSQIGEAHAERNRILPRHVYLVEATDLIASNLRLLHQAHDALHWLNYANGELKEFDRKPEVVLPAVQPKSQDV